ncbi:MAG: sialidase family protein [Halopseudomonas sp.]|uniref:sialidase family protein n=1 Tax=Halopseudomonas sp. TaxID=2901191 RepID=UPI003001E08C
MRALQSSWFRSCLFVIALSSIFASAWWLHPDRVVPGFALAVPIDDPLVTSLQAPFYRSRFASSDLDEFVHASSVTSLPSGELMAVWFAGSREGAADVQIRAARYDPITSEWGDELILATRESTSEATQRHIRKLGNPVIALAPDDRLWLFYVSVSIGGWAGSAINAMYSDDFGSTWSSPQQLITTPFLNISTLVRNAPVFHSDGTIGLPVYHEFLGKFAEYLYISPSGEVLDKSRISWGKHSLQPTVVPTGEFGAIALLRYAGDEHHRVLASRTEDAGQSWSEPYPEDPANPNSSLAAVATPSHGLLVALNDLEDGRFRLRLMGTDEGLDLWKPVIDLDESPDPLGHPFSPEVYREIIGDKFQLSSGPRRQDMLDEFLTHLDQRVCALRGCDFEYEYPYFIKSADGIYHLVYSWNNTFIKHVSFNDSWLRAQL